MSCLDSTISNEPMRTIDIMFVTMNSMNALEYGNL